MVDFICHSDTPVLGVTRMCSRKATGQGRYSLSHLHLYFHFSLRILRISFVTYVVLDHSVVYHNFL